MRRAYNSGDWENARKYAMKIIENPDEEKLAKSVVVRSYWNQNKMVQLQIYLDKWPDIDFEDIRRKVRNSHKQAVPYPDFKKDWDSVDLPGNYIQEGEVLWLKTPNSWVHWIMPEGFVLGNTHS